MTEEEYFRKTYPDSCYGDRPLSPHFDFFQDGVEFGERQSEKKNTELRDELDERTKDLLNSNHRIGQLEQELQDLKDRHAEEVELHLHAEDYIKSLEQQIEKMKCCENCRHPITCNICNNYDKWEIKENDR